ncbi:MAG: YrdB family protein [Acidimicrobiia bacterium]|nr:YrdB family protein [Acidimicrobiia bacterium]
MRRAVESLRFLLQVAAFVALAIWGWQAVDDPALSAMLAVAAPGLAAAAWGIWVAPMAPARLDDPTRLVVELVVFDAAVVALLLAGHVTWAIVYAVAVVAHLAIMGRRGWRSG